MLPGAKAGNETASDQSIHFSYRRFQGKSCKCPSIATPFGFTIEAKIHTNVIKRRQST
jgi:hypothetical protein